MNFIDLDKFKVTVTKITNENISNFNLSGKIDHTKSSFSDSNSNIFIEFSKNDMGYTLCNCILLNNDRLKSIIKILENKILETNFEL